MPLRGGARLEILSLSPDGSRLFFRAVAAGETGSRWLVNADGTGLRETTCMVGPLQYAANRAWWGDGRRLFATSSPAGAGPC